MKREYMLAILLERKEFGDTFGRWPLHITLVPWFQLQKPLDELVAAIELLLQGHQSFTVRVGAAASWKSHNVRLIDSSALHALHRHLLDEVRQFGEVTATSHIGVQYTPHITQKQYAKVQEGYAIPIKRVYIVEAPIANPVDRIKKVVGVGELR